MTEIDEFVRLARSCREQELRVALSSAMAIVAEYETARSTISEQEKRIAELEYDAEAHECGMLFLDALKIPRHDADGIVYSLVGRIQQALTAERRRREEGEAWLKRSLYKLRAYIGVCKGDKELTETIVPGLDAHFRKYEPGK